jgi:hypothetical protein
LVKLKDGRFLLVISKNLENHKNFTKALKEIDIDYVCLECEIADYPKNPDYFIPEDGHPSSLLNNIKGKTLAKHINEKSF